MSSLHDSMLRNLQKTDLARRREGSLTWVTGESCASSCCTAKLKRNWSPSSIIIAHFTHSIWRSKRSPSGRWRHGMASRTEEYSLAANKALDSSCVLGFHCLEAKRRSWDKKIRIHQKNKQKQIRIRQDPSSNAAGSPKSCNRCKTSVQTHAIRVLRHCMLYLKPFCLLHS